MDGKAASENQNNTFNTYLFTAASTSLISTLPLSTPLFLYLSLPLIHLPIHPDEQVLRERETQLRKLGNVWRRRTGAMAVMLNTAVQQVVLALYRVLHYRIYRYTVCVLFLYCYCVLLYCWHHMFISSHTYKNVYILLNGHCECMCIYILICVYL